MISLWGIPWFSPPRGTGYSPRCSPWTNTLHISRREVTHRLHWCWNYTSLTHTAPPNCWPESCGPVPGARQRCEEKTNTDQRISGSFLYPALNWKALNILDLIYRRRWARVIWRKNDLQTNRGIHLIFMSLISIFITLNYNSHTCKQTVHLGWGASSDILIQKTLEASSITHHSSP